MNPVPLGASPQPFLVGPSFALFVNSSKTLPLAIINLSDQLLSWSVMTDAPNWLNVDRLTGTLQKFEIQTIYVTAQSGQNEGDFQGKLIFTPTVGGIALANVQLPVELHVRLGIYTDNGPKNPLLIQNHIDFVSQNVDNTLQVQNNPRPLGFSNQAVNGSVKWTIVSKVNWLTVDTAAGMLPSPPPGVVLGAPQKIVNVMVQNAPTTTGTYRTELMLTLTFNDPALADHEPTSVLIPVKLIVP